MAGTRRRRRLLVALGAAVLAALVGGRLASDLYVDALWFSHLGFGGYFWKLRISGWLLSLMTGLLAGGFLFAGLHPFVRLAPRLHVRRRYGDLEIAEVVPRRYLTLGVTAIAVVFGAVVGLYAGSTWTLPVLQLLNAPEWGAGDPVFSHDLRFYVFALPLISGLHGLIVVVVLFTIAMAVIGHLLTGGLSVRDGRLRISDAAHRQLAILAAILMVAIAAGFWIGMRQLLWSGNGPTGSFGFADAAARLPAGRVLILLSVLAGAAFLYGAWQRNILYGPIALGVVGIATLVMAHIYPAVIQRLRVDPNELERERLYLGMNIEFTRRAYGLDRFDEREYPLDLERRPGTQMIERVTAGLPLWDTRPLRATFNQLQGIDPYYTFVDVDYDRYRGDGRLEQVAVSVREIDIEQLPPEARTWQNLHLSARYTHGLGLVMTPAAAIQPNGSPRYYISGLPPAIAQGAPAGLKLERPEVFFGERTSEYILVNGASEDELGPLGVGLDALHRRLSFAWTLGDKNLLLSEEIGSDTRIVYERNVQARIERLAPFLILDPDIYPVLADGRIFWIQDAYTTTAYFPLARRVRMGDRWIRYLRNSVKVVVDGLTGATAFYSLDTEDPILGSLDRTFPGLFRPIEELSESLRDHLRYPTQSLMIQAQVLQAYHVQDPRALYHQLDLWDLPVERYREGEERVRPYHVVMPVPGEGEDEFILVYPLTARGRDNLRAFLLARTDRMGEPDVLLYRLPSQQVLGPRQVEVRIDQDPFISQQLTLWQQRGSSVMRGHLMTVPLDGTLVYLEPIYLEAESGGAAPSLERVVLVTHDRVAMGEDIETAIAALRSGRPAGPLTDGEAAALTPASVARLRDMIERADVALRSGDLATFGRLWSEIRRLSSESGEGEMGGPPP